MSRIIVTGCGTSVGKTIVSSILVTALNADYWKPIECGGEEDSDTKTLTELTSSVHRRIYPAGYALKAPLSPHHAARLENVKIDPQRLVPPQTPRPLLMETAGGLLVPLSEQMLLMDLFESWEGCWVVVSQLYLGSINHTLLTIEALKQRRVKLGGVIFNGTSIPDSEEAILSFSKLPCLGRLYPEVNLTRNTIEKYAAQWKTQLSSLLT